MIRKRYPFRIWVKIGDVRQVIGYSKAFDSFPAIRQPSIKIYTNLAWESGLGEHDFKMRIAP